MESDIMPLHPSNPPPGVGDGGLGSEEEFGDFSVGVSCSPLGFADDTEGPPSCRQPSTAVKPATHQPHSCFNPPLEQSQHMSTVKLESGRGYMDVERQNCNAKSSLQLANGYTQGDYTSRALSASIVGTCSLEEETGFADFSVFREQAAHPWCCGFTEQSDGSVGGAIHIGSEQISHSGQGVIMESEPRSQHVYKTKEDVCIMVKHCEKGDAGLVQPPQDHHQPQEAAAALQVGSAEEKSNMSGDTQGERRCSCTLQTYEVQRITENIPPTTCMYKSTSDALASLCDELSTESADLESSADLEQNLSSLASQDDRTDCDRTDDEDEELGRHLHADSLVSGCVVNLSLSELEKDSQDGNHYATQETTSTSSQSQAGTNTEDRCADFTDGSLEHGRDREPVQSADAGVQSLGNLPPSDSFADFCSAPTQEDGEGLWADFEDQSAPSEGKTWSQFREPVSSLQTDGDEKEREMTRTHGDMRWNSCKVSLSCRVQQLLESSFPMVTVPAVEGEEGLLNLSALLQLQHPPKSELETPELSCAQSSLRIHQVMVWPYLDLHNSVGLRFRWAGSHSNRTLLGCLGVDTENIVFVGTKKQPVTVSAYASSLGMLELTKDSVPAVCSPGHTAISAPRRPQDKLDPPAHSVQELPSIQLDWSSRGLSSSQDGMSSRRVPHFWGWK